MSKMSTFQPLVNYLWLLHLTFAQPYLWPTRQCWRGRGGSAKPTGSKRGCSPRNGTRRPRNPRSLSTMTSRGSIATAGRCVQCGVVRTGTFASVFEKNQKIFVPTPASIVARFHISLHSMNYKIWGHLFIRVSICYTHASVGLLRSFWPKQAASVDSILTDAPTQRIPMGQSTWKSNLS